ncbi:HNH endonuclease signature motif containing protein [Georgenia halophila]|uniref:HNH endonuclease signature motif containing protein n=1 Tax=Georgenia halophila TaxID=620889 RepID=A0ABP8L526_9MICO
MGVTTMVRPLGEVEAELATLAARIASATCRFLQLVAEFDARDGWMEVAGMVSTAQWLSWRCGMSTVTAREHVRIARALAGLPLIAQAFAEGRLSYSKVRALTRVATAETEVELLDIAAAATANQLERFCVGVRTATTLDEVNERHEDRRLSFRTEWDGSVSFSGRCSPEDGAVIVEALRRVQDYLARTSADRLTGGADATDSSGTTVAADEAEATKRRALIDALVLLCEHATIDDDTDGRTDVDVDLADDADNMADADSTTAAAPATVARGSRRSETVVHATLDDLAAIRVAETTPPAQCPGRADRDVIGPRLEYGPALHPETARRLTCDTGVVLHLHQSETEDEPGTSVIVTPSQRPGRTVDVGRRRRTPNAAQFRALWDRDQGCRFPGCERRRYLHAHHIVHWADGGLTVLENLVLLCGEHHRLHHEGGFEVARHADGSLTFFGQNGQPVVPVPRTEVPAPAVTAGLPLPVGASGRATDDAPDSLAPVDGGRLDMDYAVSTVVGAWEAAKRRARGRTAASERPEHAA